MSSPRREVLVNSDWMSVLGMLYLLGIALLGLIRDWRWLQRGATQQPVSYFTVITAAVLLCYAVALPMAKIFRVAAGLFAMGAAIQAAVFNLHAPGEAQRLANINRMVFALVACVLVLVRGAQWFRKVCRLESTRFEGEADS